MQEYDGFIYMWCSKSTGMKYIGSHKGNTNDGYISSSEHFLCAYNSNKLDFTRSILEYVIGDIPRIREIETKYLKYYSVSSDSKFYNRSESAFGANMSGNSNPMHGVKYTEERRNKTVCTWREKIAQGYVPYNKGTTMSKTQKHKLSDTWEIISPNGTTTTISNMSEFCMQQGLNPSAMNGVAKGKRQSHKGYRCKKLTDKRNTAHTYTEWKSKGNPGKPSFGKYNGNSKSVTVDNKTYNTMREASEALNISLYKLRKLIHA